MDVALRHKKTFISFVCILLLVLVFFVLLFWNSSYKTKEVKLSSEVTNKMTKALFKDGTINLNSDELNQIINVYFKAGTYSKVTVKGIESEMKGDILYFYVPVKYKGINVLVTTYGKLNYKNNVLEYRVEHVNAGKIPIPRSLFLSKLENRIKGKASIKNNSICIDKFNSPVKIKSMRINDSKLTIKFEKISDILNNSGSSLMKILDSNMISRLQKSMNSKTAENSPSSSVSNGKDNSNQSEKASINNTKESDAALNRITSSLNSALGSANSAGAKSVISEMISAANSMKGSSNLNPYSYSGAVRASYSKLTSAEKVDLKSAVFSNVNSSDVSIISSMIGK